MNQDRDQPKDPPPPHPRDQSKPSGGADDDSAGSSNPRSTEQIPGAGTVDRDLDDESSTTRRDKSMTGGLSRPAGGSPNTPR